MHELQPAVNYQVAVLSKASGNVINHRREAWFTKIPMEIQICSFILFAILHTNSMWGDTDAYTPPCLDSLLSAPSASLFPHFCDSSHPWACCFAWQLQSLVSAAILRLMSPNFCLFYFALTLGCPLQKSPQKQIRDSSRLTQDYRPVSGLEMMP